MKTETRSVKANFRQVKKVPGSSKPSKYKWVIRSNNKEYGWNNAIEKVSIIRNGIPYESIEVIGQRLNKPIKSVLQIIGVPQTTYNKKKNEHLLLGSRDSELIVLITELINYGIEVFNNEEEKFQRWLMKPNMSLGSIAPESMLDTVTGINEINNCLNRIEYGNFA